MKPNELDEEFLEAIYHQANYDSILGDGPYSKGDMPNLVSNYRELVEKKSAEEIAVLKERIIQLEGFEQETMSDQKRKLLFRGDGLAYIRHRALKHEQEYHDPRQANHLRVLATAIEHDIAALKIALQGIVDTLGPRDVRWALAVRALASSPAEADPERADRTADEQRRIEAAR